MVFLYNLLDLKRTMWEGPELEAGKHTIVFDFKSDGPGLGKGGTGVLSVDGKEVARNSMDHTTPVTFPEDETFDIGQDTRTGVALLEYRYDAPFKFTGKIDKLTFELDPEQSTRKPKPTASHPCHRLSPPRDEKGAHFCCHSRGVFRQTFALLVAPGIGHPGASWHGHHRARILPLAA